MSRDAALMAKLIESAGAKGNRRARRWLKALTRDKGNPARATKDGRLAVPVPDKVEALLTRPWLDWPTPDPLRRRP